jgi:hypothetical protein
LPEFETADFRLLQFFQKGKSAKFNRPELAQVEKVEQDRNGRRRKAEQGKGCQECQSKSSRIKSNGRRLSHNVTN